MDYRQALEYIYGISDYDRGFITNPFAGDEAAALGLRRTQTLLDRLGNPERQLAIIHVAGTKGKGSTCAFIENVARRAGLRTGQYSTPHLHSFRERILIDGEPISRAQFAEATQRAVEASERLGAAWSKIGTPTAFEFSTAMALDLFTRQRIQLAIIEVGLGGRLDATNVILPSVSVITSISFDHESILGSTLTEIASEKAGIIKSGRPVVCAHQQAEALAVVTKMCREHDSDLYLTGRDIKLIPHHDSIDVAGPWGTIEHLRPGLIGDHQRENAALAIAALWAHDPDLIADHAIVRQGVANTLWPGRFEVVPTATGSDIVIDGAHNVDSIRRLLATVGQQYPGQPVITVFGTSREKDIDGMLGELARSASQLIAVESRNPRAADANEIAQLARARGMAAMAGGTTADGVKQARETRTDAVLVVTGSLYVVAEAREALGLADAEDVV